MSDMHPEKIAEIGRQRHPDFEWNAWWPVNCDMTVITCSTVGTYTSIVNGVTRAVTGVESMRHDGYQTQLGYWTAMVDRLADSLRDVAAPLC
jgi:hypothetical protein